MIRVWKKLQLERKKKQEESERRYLESFLLDSATATSCFCRSLSLVICPLMCTTNADLGNHADGQQPSEQADPASSSGTNFAQAVSGVSSGPTSRSVPVRTVVAAVPARPPSDSSGTAVGVFYPLLARMQHLSPGHHPNGSETGQQSASQSTVQQQSLGSINGSIIRESNSQTSPNTALFSEPGPSVNTTAQRQQGPSISTTNADPGNHDGQQPSEQADPASSSGTNFAQAVSGVSSGPTSRSVPVRTVVAAVPARPPSDSSGTAVGVFYPLLARMQHLSPGHHPNGSETGQQSASQSTVQQQSLESINGSIIRESNSQTSPNTGLFSEPGPSVNTTAQRQQEPLSVTNSSQQEPSHTVSSAQTTTVNNSTPSDAQQGEGSLRQIPSRFDQLLRTIFSGEQFHPNDMNIQGMPTGSVAEQTEAPRDSDPRRAINQGIFFSGLVRQMMPFISSTIGMEQAQATPVTSVTNPLMPMINDTTELPSRTLNSEGPQHAETTILDSSIPQSARENSVEVGSTHSRDEAPSSPHSKRQKRE